MTNKIMAQIIFTLLILLSSLTIYAQKDVTKFLDIPVEGDKAEMIQKLENKGFKYDIYLDILTGNLNNTNVIVYISTHNNAVSNIIVADTTSYDRNNIALRFNELLSNFENNPNYTKAMGQEIFLHTDMVEDNVSEHIFNTHSKSAVFLQENRNQILTKIKHRLLHKYSEEQILNPNPVFSIYCDIQIEIINYAQSEAKKQVVFYIKEQNGKYNLILSYQNLYNIPQYNITDL